MGVVSINNNVQTQGLTVQGDASIQGGALNMNANKIINVGAGVISE